jgi:hypothetical protein
MNKLLINVRWIAYAILILVDGIITVLSMSSLVQDRPTSIGLGIIGAAIVLLMTWLFLSGIREKGTKRIIMLSSWLLGVIVVVSLNWAYTGTILRTQSQSVEINTSDESFDKGVKQKQINAIQTQIDSLITQQSKLNQWQEKAREAIQKDIDGDNDKLAKLQDVGESKKIGKEVSAINVFDKMAKPMGWDSGTMSDLWWLMAFLMLQLFAVLTAPKGDEDEPEIQRVKKSVTIKSLTDIEIRKWVSIIWRNSRNGERSMIMGKELLMSEMEKSDIVFYRRWHDVLVKRAIKAGLMTSEGMILKGEQEALNKLVGSGEKIEEKVGNMII